MLVVVAVVAPVDVRIVTDVGVGSRDTAPARPSGTVAPNMVTPISRREAEAPPLGATCSCRAPAASRRVQVHAPTPSHDPYAPIRTQRVRLRIGQLP